MTRSAEDYRAHIKIAAWMLAVSAVGFIAGVVVDTQTDLNGWTLMMLGGMWFVIFAIRLMWLTSKVRILGADASESDVAVRPDSEQIDDRKTAT